MSNGRPVFSVVGEEVSSPDEAELVGTADCAPAPAGTRETSAENISFSLIFCSSITADEVKSACSRVKEMMRVHRGERHGSEAMEGGTSEAVGYILLRGGEGNIDWHGRTPPSHGIRLQWHRSGAPARAAGPGRTGMLTEAIPFARRKVAREG